MITAQALTRKYGDNFAVNEISFRIEAREIVGLLGHNGAGKTTIMKIITGFLEPTSGTVLVDDLDVRSNRLEIQRKIGYLPENCPLYPEMYVMEFLEYAASLKGVPEEERDARIKEAVRKTRLDDVVFKQVNTLSRGYRQRLGVAQAILSSPSILILDEPTNGLDPSQIIEMRSLIKELSGSATVVISTHILQEVQAVCDRVIIINKGRLALDSPMADLRPTNRISVLLDQPPAKVEPVVEEVEGVVCLSSERQSDGRTEYVLELDSGDEASPVLARKLVERGFKLYSMRPHFRDLETIFGEISSGKESMEPPEPGATGTPATESDQKADAEQEPKKDNGKSPDKKPESSDVPETEDTDNGQSSDGAEAAVEEKSEEDADADAGKELQPEKISDDEQETELKPAQDQAG